MSQLRDELENLLHRAGSAHGIYENQELYGVYDQNWHRWYAAWLLEHGMNQELNSAFDVETFALVLFQLNEEHKKAKTNKTWAQFTAKYLIEQYRN